MGLLDIGLGSGLADQAAQKLSGRELQLKEQECSALGMEYDAENDSCREVSQSEPQLD